MPTTKITHAHGDKGVMDVLGDERWARQQSANIFGTLAANPGSGGLASAGAGLGGMAQQMFAPMQQQTPPPATPSSSADDPVAALKKLKDMLDLGLIEQTDFDAKKAEIISKM